MGDAECAAARPRTQIERTFHGGSLLYLVVKSPQVGEKLEKIRIGIESEERPIVVGI